MNQVRCEHDSQGSICEIGYSIILASQKYKAKNSIPGFLTELSSHTNYKTRETYPITSSFSGEINLMGSGSLVRIVPLCSLLLLLLFPVIHGWGIEGHTTVCRIAQVLNCPFLILSFHPFFSSVWLQRANSIINLLVLLPYIQSRLSDAAADAVKQLLPKYAENDLGTVCIWADRVKFRYHWSSALHYIDTPDNLCTYQYNSKPILHEH